MALGEVAGAAGGTRGALQAAVVHALASVLTADSAHHYAKRDAAQALGKVFVRTPDPAPAPAAADSKDAKSAAAVTAVRAGSAGRSAALSADAKQPLAMCIQALLKGSVDGDEQVRYMSCFALSRVALAVAPQFPEALQPLTVAALAHALNDSCRYVVANAIEALKNMRTAESIDLAFRALTVLRWCPITTMQKAF